MKTSSGPASYKGLHLQARNWQSCLAPVYIIRLTYRFRSCGQPKLKPADACFLIPALCHLSPPILIVVVLGFRYVLGGVFFQTRAIVPLCKETLMLAVQGLPCGVVHTRTWTKATSLNDRRCFITGKPCNLLTLSTLRMCCLHAQQVQRHLLRAGTALVHISAVRPFIYAKRTPLYVISCWINRRNDTPFPEMLLQDLPHTPPLPGAEQGMRFG